MSSSCATCLLCLRRSYGYSNWTVNGARLYCLANRNPALDGQETDELTPELATALDAALTCPKYREGAPATLDVDQEWRRDDEYELRPLTPALVQEAGCTDDAEAAELLVKHLITRK